MVLYKVSCSIALDPVVHYPADPSPRADGTGKPILGGSGDALLKASIGLDCVARGVGIDRLCHLCGISTV